MQRTLFFQLILGGLLLAGAHNAAAVPIVVNTTNDVVAEDGQCSLREAIINANGNDQSGSADCAAGGAGIIEFDPALTGSTITLSGSELPTITAQLTIQGPVTKDAASITIDGDSASRVLNIQGSTASEFSVQVSAVTVSGGRTTGQFARGGGITVFGADLILDNVVLTGNTTTGSSAGGGGMHLSEGNLTLIGGAIAGNSTQGLNASGGGLHILNGTITSFNSVIAGNSTAGDSGGGGGASISQSAAILIGSTVSGNSTAGAEAAGGGLIVSAGDLTLIGSTVSNNSTTGAAANGGGLFFRASSSIRSFTLINTTVSGNSTAGKEAAGGGIFVRDCGVSCAPSAPVNLSLTHASIAFNTAAGGADGIHLARENPDSTFTLENSLIAQDGAGQAACSDTADSATSSLATDNSCGPGVFVASPEGIGLAPLSFNGGPTRTHALDVASLAVNNAGDCGAAFGVNTDQRGFPRPGVGSGACDIGAYEFQHDAIFRDRFEAP